MDEKSNSTLGALIYSGNNFGFWLGHHVDLATIMLVMMFVGMWRMLAIVQKRKTFDLADLMKNSEGKVSFLNTGGIGCFIFSTWVIMHDTLAGTLSDTQYIGYLIFWSGAPVANVLASKWDGRLPWSKPQ